MTPDPSLQKADFDAIYDQPDPRTYFSTLEPFEYAIPQHGADIFAPLLQARAESVERKPRLLDVCCSYGIIATLLKTDLDLEDVYAHYGDAATESLSLDELVATDQRLLRERGRPEAPHVVGLDVAQRAVEYAVTTGVLDAGFSENLEVNDPSAELAAALSDIDLITTTGGIGYVTGTAPGWRPRRWHGTSDRRPGRGPGPVAACSTQQRVARPEPGAHAARAGAEEKSNQVLLTAVRRTVMIL